ncbi:hypothetical protein H257_19458 [Aphanomyces astaci]|uniref:Uncharacterized protein n=1 Tax=Aphanomyces astaci TaxID=112090 RepID=W4F844_APHAT|nr:hypothetical protein H257_19458 [Aphanomyces astaci]ETV63612.1 hypothetical protein H257_19458 [Aphanomyces astaci]|eukprot:XP_009846903.1 hypothetical protein H257_19458 [Aphanomyces astaci]
MKPEGLNSKNSSYKFTLDTIGPNATLLREEEKTLLREREAFAQEVNKSYSNLRRQQSSLQVDQKTLALQLQEGRLRSGSVGTPYATPASSRKGSPSKGSLSTFTTSSVLQAPYSMAGTPQRTMDPIPVFMQQTEVATETMSMPVPAGVYGRAVTSQKPFMPERPRQREPPEYIPQDSYGMRGHSNPSPPYFTPAYGDRGGLQGGPGDTTLSNALEAEEIPPDLPGEVDLEVAAMTMEVEAHPGFHTCPRTMTMGTVLPVPLMLTHENTHPN